MAGNTGGRYQTRPCPSVPQTPPVTAPPPPPPPPRSRRSSLSRSGMTSAGSYGARSCRAVLPSCPGALATTNTAPPEPERQARAPAVYSARDWRTPLACRRAGRSGVRWWSWAALCDTAPTIEFSARCPEYTARQTRKQTALPSRAAFHNSWRQSASPSGPDTGPHRAMCGATARRPRPRPAPASASASALRRWWRWTA